MWTKQRNKSPNCLINLSHRKLSMRKEESLRFGLDYHTLPKKVNVNDIKANIEQFLNRLKVHESFDIDDETCDDIKYVFKQFINGEKSDRKNVALHQTLKNLADDTSIMICKFDKGHGVSILNINDYFEKLDSIINDHSKFREVVQIKKDHPIIKKENSIKYYIKTYFKEFEPETVEKLTPSGSSPGKMYDLVRVHKDNNPVRPVVSIIGTPGYQLAKFLDVIIKPYIPQTYTLQSNKQFLDRINNFQFDTNQKLVSFDVSSLFTNVPLEEIMQLITKRIYDSKHQDVKNK